MNQPITNTEIKTVIEKKKTLPKNNSPEPDGFTEEFYPTFREEINEKEMKEMIAKINKI